MTNTNKSGTYRNGNGPGRVLREMRNSDIVRNILDDIRREIAAKAAAEQKGGR